MLFITLFSIIFHRIKKETAINLIKLEIDEHYSEVFNMRADNMLNILIAKNIDASKSMI